MVDSFSPFVAEKLAVYVYRLIDPRNGETFYVGKGRNDRVFMHVKGIVRDDQHTDGESEGPPLDAKLDRVRAIHNAGLEVQHVIHRHGLDEDTAVEIEAALIDAYPGLTNEQSGRSSGERGTMHAKEIVELYEALEADFTHDLLEISVAQSADKEDLYGAVRAAWRISKDNAARVDYVLAVRRGLILGAFTATQWLEHTPENFPGASNRIGHPYYGFVGKEAPAEIRSQYVRKRVPERYRRKPGEAAPFRYIWARSRPRSE